MNPYRQKELIELYLLALLRKRTMTEPELLLEVDDWLASDYTAAKRCLLILRLKKDCSRRLRHGKGIYYITPKGAHRLSAFLRFYKAAAWIYQIM